jgi:hypothetical protein
MMFNEPSVDITCEGGEVTVELRGATFNDPTTGDSTFVKCSEIECWFIDTSFEDEFVIREAFFPRGELPSPASCRWLRSQIPSSLLNPNRSSLRARFATPRTGRIGVWVATRHGDEATAVLGVDETATVSR